MPFAGIYFQTIIRLIILTLLFQVNLIIQVCNIKWTVVIKNKLLRENSETKGGNKVTYRNGIKRRV